MVCRTSGYRRDGASVTGRVSLSAPPGVALETVKPTRSAGLGATWECVLMPAWSSQHVHVRSSMRRTTREV